MVRGEGRQALCADGRQSVKTTGDRATPQVKLTKKFLRSFFQKATA
jgi:hypothetical protein